VVGVARDGDRLLVIQRSSTVRAPLQWCFPGGGIEPGETPADAIVREFREEVGLEVRAVRPLYRWLREDGFLDLEWWEVEVVGGELRLNHDEVADARWLTDEEIRTHRGIIPHNLVFLDHYRRLVPGASAAPSPAGPLPTEPS
jgi:8-oxo-dGTP diphosphatase